MPTGLNKDGKWVSSGSVLRSMGIQVRGPSPLPRNMDDDLETIKTNMIKLQKRNEELEEENAKLKAGTMLREADEEIKRLKSAVAWQKETIAARDATISRLEAALVPFSKLNIEDGKGGKVHIWHSDIRNARAALEPNRTEADIVGKEEDET